MKNNRKGFTLAELLIVVAIIAVLVAIAIPVFTTQLEKSREAVDASNIRAAYAEVMTESMTNDKKSCYKAVDLKQGQQGWQNTENDFPANLLAPTATAYNGATFQSTVATETTIATGNNSMTVYVVYKPAADATTPGYTYITATQPTGTDVTQLP